MFIYLASPYTANPEENFLLAEKYAASQIIEGHPIFSPIVHCHEMAIKYNMPKDYGFWRTYALNMLQAAAALLVLMLPGWKESVGVTDEIAFATRNEIPIFYVDPALIEGML